MPRRCPICNAVIDAGGVPLLIPANLDEAALLQACLRLDGLLFTGGGDIDPDLFAGTAHPAVYGIEPDRDRSEIALVRRAAETGLPFLGICRGIQVINVALGGTLYTHIADQMSGACKHDYFPDFPRDQIAHDVAIQAGSRLVGILGGEQHRSQQPAPPGPGARGRRPGGHRARPGRAGRSGRAARASLWPGRAVAPRMAAGA